MNKHQQGFTLMEIIIAMFVFAIIMGIVVGGFGLVIRTNERVREQHAYLSELQRAVTIITRDLSQVIPRTVLDNDGQTLAGIVQEDDAHRFEFTRGGYVNPFAMAKRSNFLRVAYSFENNSIIRTVWPVLDRAPSTEPLQHPLLTNVVDFTIKMIDTNGEFLPDAGYEALPVAILMTIQLPHDHIITRVIPTGWGHNA